MKADDRQTTIQQTATTRRGFSFAFTLAALVVCGGEEGQVVEFHMGGLVCLHPKRSGAGYAVAWVLQPELIRA